MYKHVVIYICYNICSVIWKLDKSLNCANVPYSHHHHILINAPKTVHIIIILLLCKPPYVYLVTDSIEVVHVI